MTTVTQDTRYFHPESGDFKVSLDDIKAKNRGVIWGTEIDLDLLASLGYFAIVSTERPVNDVVVEIEPVYTDGEYVQTWNQRAFTEEEVQALLDRKKSDLRTRLADVLQSCLYIGAPHNFGTTEEPRIMHVQLRNQDRTNHAGIKAISDMNPGLNQPFRPYENIEVEVPFDKIDALMNTAYTGYMKYMRYFWDLKDQITAATAVANLPQIPYSAEAVFAEFEWDFPAKPLD